MNTGPGVLEGLTDGGPSLRSAKQHTNCAAEVLVEIRAAQERLRAYNAVNPIVVSVDRAAYEAGEPLAPTIRWSKRVPDYSGPRVALTTGELLYHLRSALDHLVYNLAWLDSKQRQDWTQFLIEDTEKGWRKNVGRRLVGVNAEHCRAIREYQPLSGCEWTRTLRDLSNADKHRFVITPIQEYTGQIRNHPDSLRPDPDDRSKLLMEVSQPSAMVTLPDGSGIVETLTDLCVDTAKVLLRFQGDFGENDSLTMANDQTSTGV